MASIIIINNRLSEVKPHEKMPRVKSIEFTEDFIRRPSK